MVSVMGGPLETSISLRNASASALACTASGSPTVSVNQLRHDPDGHAVCEFMLGEKALLKQDLARARKYFLIEAHVELGSTAFRSGRLDEAKLEFKRALELDPKQSMAWGNLAALLYQNKEYDGAEETARDGIRNVPNDPKLHFVLGAARMAKGQYTGDTAQHLDLVLKDFRMPMSC
jgi:tetratricopeptide (TPR) repeat protein